MPLPDLLRDSTVLTPEFFNRRAEDVARDLLGKVIVNADTAGRIVEVEAYLGVSDLAAHAAAGITPRTRVLFGAPGRAYVYLIYGMYECLNFVAEPEGEAGCVLIRALEPICGLSTMHHRRPAARRVEDLCSGPGKLTRALAITRDLNGADVTIARSTFTVRHLAGSPAPDIDISTRIGISKCVDWPLRFSIPKNPFVSRR